MTFDRNAVKKLSKKEENRILLKSGTLFYIIGAIISVLGLLMLMCNFGLGSLAVIIPGIFITLIGFKNLLLKNEKREKFLTSKLLGKAIKLEKQNGNKLSKEEVKKINFKYDPIFHDKVMMHIHKTEDNKYFKNIKNAEDKIKFLKNARKNEIQKFSNNRWQTAGGKNLEYNLVEGKIRINQTEHLFSAIRAAEVNKQDSYRIITTDKVITKEKGKSKKHISVGKALVGGILFNVPGAIVGAAMGKRTTKKELVTNGTSVSNSIPTCNHIGVVIDINGFKSEVILLNHTVDQSSSYYKTSLQYAEEIVSKLHFLATQPVPENFKKVEEEISVLEYDRKIVSAQEELKKIKANKPTYDIPQKYLQ